MLLPWGRGGEEVLLEGLQHELRGKKEIAFAEGAKAKMCITIICWELHCGFFSFVCL